jgi:ribose transport system ATP-binding protein
MVSVTKRFGRIEALRGVDLDAYPGEVHAIVGENGAGKSTLMRVLSGAVSPDGGRVELDGIPLPALTPARARRRGIAMIYQELSLAPHLTVEENITLGIERRTFGFVKHPGGRIGEVLSELGHPGIDPGARVSALSVAERQIVEIARALFAHARVVIMDEPTSSLSALDAERLFAVIGRLKLRGVTVLYISHFLDEVRRIADRYTVLRDGRSVACGSIAETTMGAIVGMMIGRALTEMFPAVRHAIGEEVLRVTDLRCPPRVERVSLSLRRGEILGIAGLVGSGRTELLRCIYGLDQYVAGEIVLRDGDALVPCPRRPRRAICSGISFLSEDRKTEGLAMSLSICDNVSLSSLPRFAGLGALGLLRQGRLLAAVRERCAGLGMRYRDESQRVCELSGGNQQKAALARMLLEEGAVLLLDEPTRGIDVGSKAEIYSLVGQLAAKGIGIILVSSHLPELFGVCDSLAVMHRGRLSETRPVGDWSREQAMSWAASGREAP